MSKSAQVIVIGGGIIGCAASYYLAKQGVSVIVLEQQDIMCNGGSSRNGGGVRQSARDVRELPLAIYGVENMWPTLSEELGVDVQYHQDGNLRLAKTDAHIKTLENLVDKNLKAGLELSMIDGQQAREICPYMSEEVIAASWCPTDGHANPMLASLAFYRAARRLGVQFITGTAVKEIRKYRGRAQDVVTADGTIYSGDSVILACGYFSIPIAETVGVRLPMQPRRIDMIVTEALPPMFYQMLGTAASDFYGHQTNHGSFVFGGDSGQEFVDGAQVSHGLPTNPLTAPCICRGIMKYFPALADTKIVRTWSGWTDRSIDGVPVIDSIDEVPGLVVAAGFSGHGFGISPAVGMTLAQLAQEQTTTIDISGLQYDRFHAKA